MGQSSMISDDQPPYFTAVAENDMTSSGNVNKNLSEHDLDASFQADNSSMNNHHLLKSKHDQSPNIFWTVIFNSGTLLFILTVLLLLTMAPPVFGSFHGGEVQTHRRFLQFYVTRSANAIQRQEFIFASGQSSHQEGICPAGDDKTEKSFAIEPGSGFTFSQEVRSSLESLSLLGNVRVDGEIHVKPATEALGPSIRVDVVTCASDPDMIHFEATEAPDSSITMIITPGSFPTGHANDNRTNAYVNANVTIWVKPGTILPKLKIWTQSLSIILHPGLQFQVEGQLELLGMHGSIESLLSSEPLTSIDAREIIIKTTSGSVSGAYPLYDLLSINTLSGSIDINLDLQEISKTVPKPAKLLIDTLSGEVHVTTPLLSTQHTAIPLRDYQSEIASHSGSIDIVIPHGSNSTLRSLSGDISAALHPCGDPSTLKSSLSSRVNSGSTRITIHPSRTDPTTPLRKFSGSHHQQSGSLQLHYPAQWEGDITGETMTGTVHIDWPGLDVISDDRTGWVNRRIVARKGDAKGEAEGKLEFGTMSGDVDLTGGDFY